MYPRKGSRLQVEKALKAGDTLNARTVRDKYGVSSDMLRRTVMAMKAEGYDIVSTRIGNGFHHRLRQPGETVEPQPTSHEADKTSQLLEVAGLVGQKIQVTSVIIGINDTFLVFDDRGGNTWKVNVRGMVPALRPQAALEATKPVVKVPAKAPENPVEARTEPEKAPEAVVTPTVPPVAPDWPTYPPLAKPQGQTNNWTSINSVTTE